MSVTLRKRKLKTGKTSLYLDYYIHGKRQYEYLNMFLIGEKQSDENITELAKAIRSKRELEIKNEEFGFKVKHKRESNFYDFYERVTQSKSNFKSYNLTLKHFKNFTDAKSRPILRFNEITPLFLQEFQAYLLKQVKQDTARGLYHNIRHVLKKAVLEGIIQSNPSDNVPNIKRVQAKREFLFQEEVEKLAVTPCTHNEVKKAFLFSCFTGLRYSDLLRLTWGNVKGNQIELVQKKTKEPLFIPLSKTALQILGERGKQDEQVFKMPTTSYTNIACRMWLANARIEKHITFHSARHTYATLLLTKGAGIYEVSKLLGHSRVENTQIYTKMIDSKKQEAVNRLPEIEVSL